jgi:predicted RNA-binding Zn ribbon-like protein
MMRIPHDAPVLIPLPAGHLCLGFVNTLGWRGRPQPSESLNNVNDLLAWLRASAGMGEALKGQAWEVKRRPALLADAIALREALFGIFKAVAAGSRPPEPDLERVQLAVAAAPARRRIAPVRSGFAWQVQKVQSSLPFLLAPVLWSAADLLVSDERHRVRLCANPECLWLFLDASRNATRLWCDMTACGNRAKARRHYLRSKQT